ncbi:hypothetical protein AAHC03_0965 [Spirometra sp. Aus1]
MVRLRRVISWGYGQKGRVSVTRLRSARSRFTPITIVSNAGTDLLLFDLVDLLTPTSAFASARLHFLRVLVLLLWLLLSSQPQFLLSPPLGSTVGEPHLNARLSEAQPGGQLLSGKDVRIVGLFEF